jgi:hypothetical protein
MSERLFGFIGRMMGRDPARRVCMSAVSQAKRDVSDEAATAALRAEIGDIPTGVLDRGLAGWGSRRDYLGDRVYRLLVAARDGGSVAPIARSDRIVFEQEAILGRLPMAEAFQRLADVEPELRRCEEAALARKKMQPADLTGLVGPGARRSDPVLQGEIAIMISLIYLRGCALGRSADVRTYFERFHGSSHGTLHALPIEG